MNSGMTSGGRGAPIPSAASFNTERDLKGVWPGRTLEEKAQVEQRRSSFSEKGSSRSIVEEEEGQNEEEYKQANGAIPEEPFAPKPGKKSNPMAGILQPNKQPVILTSKPVFANLYKKRNEEGSANSDTIE
jgi:hypothetical protein